MILNTFACYSSCKLELKKIEEYRKFFYDSISGVGLKGVSYTDFIKASSTNSKLSHISDLLEEWDRNNRIFRRYCVSTIKLCDGWLKQMDAKNRSIFTKRYIEDKTLKEIGDEIGHDESYVGKLIRKESERIKEGFM